jgi:hypothetical protein
MTKLAALFAAIEALPEAESGRDFVLTREKRGSWSAQFIGLYVPRNRSENCATPEEAIVSALADLRRAGEACGVGTLGYREAGGDEWIATGTGREPNTEMLIELGHSASVREIEYE